MIQYLADEGFEFTEGLCEVGSDCDGWVDGLALQVDLVNLHCHS